MRQQTTEHRWPQRAACGARFATYAPRGRIASAALQPQSALVHWAVTSAIGKSTLPLPPPTSTRILASSRFPRVMPWAAHALK